MKIESIDNKKLQTKAETLLNIWGNMMQAGSIYIGDKLGLYKGLVETGPITYKKFAKHMIMNERYIQEWLEGQVAAGFLKYDFNSQLFSIPPESACLLANEGSTSYMAGIFSQIHPLYNGLKNILKCFTTGEGFHFDELGAETVIFQEKVFAGWYKNELIQNILPTLEDNITKKLTAGAQVADIGCGSGIAIIELAKYFPKSHFYGFELSQQALKKAKKNLTEAALKNVHFYDVSSHDLPCNHSLDLVLTFDCVHDMSNPGQVAKKIFDSLKLDGTWFISDLKVENSFKENLNNPLTKYFYACSLVCCLPSSSCGKNSARLGTLGFSPNKAKQLAIKTGFTRFKMHDFNNPFNLYYEIRP